MTEFSTEGLDCYSFRTHLFTPMIKYITVIVRCVTWLNTRVDVTGKFSVTRVFVSNRVKIFQKFPFYWKILLLFYRDLKNLHLLETKRRV